MESRPDSAAIDPYAPPKTNPIDTDANLDQDGYASKYALVTNEHFKSPLICVKLGISLENEENLQPTIITITKKSKLPKPIHKLILSLVVISGLIGLSASTPYDIILLIASISLWFLINTFMVSPYKIPFYFSKQYLQLRKKHIFIFLSILTLFILGYLYCLQMNSFGIIHLFMGFFITLIIFHFKIKHFTINQFKDDFVYLHGAHSDFLKALPQLPLHTKSANQEKPSI